MRVSSVCYTVLKCGIAVNADPRPDPCGYSMGEDNNEERFPSASRRRVLFLHLHCFNRETNLITNRITFFFYRFSSFVSNVCLNFFHVTKFNHLNFCECLTQPRSHTRSAAVGLSCRRPCLLQDILYHNRVSKRTQTPGIETLFPLVSTHFLHVFIVMIQLTLH